MRFPSSLVTVLLYVLLQLSLHAQITTIVYDGVTGVEHCHMVNDSVTIMHVVKKSQAWEAGVMAKDMIVTIDGIPVSGRGFSLREVFDMLLDTYGTTVKLGIKREGEDAVLYFTLKRELNDSPTIWYDYSFLVDSTKSLTAEEIWKDTTGSDFTHVLDAKIHVTEVEEDSKAEKLGIRKGDRLIGLSRPMDNHDFQILQWNNFSNSYFDTAIAVRRGSDTLQIPFDPKDKNAIEGISSQFWDDFEQQCAWLKFRFSTRISEDRTYLFTIDCYTDSILLFEQTTRGDIQQKKTGSSIKPDQRDYIHKGWDCFRIPLKKDQDQIILLQIVSPEKLYPPYLSLVPLNTIIQFDRLERAIIGAFSGIMILICFYYLVLYFSAKRRQFLYYSLFAVSFITMLLFEWDYHTEFMGGKILLLINDLSDLIYSLPIFLFLLFGIHYLDFREHLRTLHKIARIDIIVLIGSNLILNGYYLAVPFGENHWALNVLVGIHALSSYVIPLGLLLVGSIIRIIRGFNPAWYFLSGFVIVIVLAIIQISSWQTISSESAYISDIREILGNYVVVFGATLQFLIFSLGLARKIKLDEMEKEQAQLKAIEQLKENEQLKDKLNTELEQKVRERTKEIQDKKEEIESQRDEIEAQRDEIEAQRDVVVQQKEHIELTYNEISASIDYATRLQTSILPEHTLLKESFVDSFVIFLPKQKVSGDFYWWSEVKNHVVIAVADCTGHGVPGAFMSMLGISLLREIVNKDQIIDPGNILRRLRKEVIRSLGQKGDQDEQKDGMDVALISINIDSLECKYSGANNPMYLIRKKDLIEYKPDRMPISYHHQMGRFTTNEIQLQPGDQVYMFSDGFVDQFGGNDRKKFKAVKFKELLLSMNQESLDKQKQLLEEAFDTWKANYEQIDDVCIVGIRI